MRCLILTTQQANAVRTAQLQPREIAAGAYSGKHALPERVLSDPAHEAKWETLAGFPAVELDVSAAWPET